MPRSVDLLADGNPWPKHVPSTRQRIAVARDAQAANNRRRRRIGMRPRPVMALADSWTDDDGRLLVRVIPVHSLEAITRRDRDSLRKTAHRAIRARLEEDGDLTHHEARSTTLPLYLHTTEHLNGRILAVTYRTR